MPIAGKGMLITWMNVDPAEEDDFNLWYDREHLAERVRIEGFMEARRWLAVEAPTKYFCTYSTETFDTLNGPAYKAVLANQTEWSKRHIAGFRDPGRVVGRVTQSRGQGRGAALGVVRLRPAPDRQEALRSRLLPLLDPGTQPGIISLHLVESDPELSKTLTDADTPNPGAADWYVLIDGTEPGPVRDLIQSRFSAVGAPVITIGTFRLLWDLVKGEL
jgi:hypothetical protein